MVLLALFVHTASAQTGLPAPCDSDFAVHHFVDGQAANEALADAGDIDRVSERAEDSSRLMIALTPNAAERMESFTSRNIGEQLVVVCGGEQVWRARINATFGKRFEIGLGDDS
jgi:preprotein translocase subunit SecD